MSGPVVLTVECAPGPLDAVVADVPGSKSIANRALVCAALAGGRSELLGLPDGDDTTAMLDCVARLGAGVESGDGRGGGSIVVGTGGVLAPGPVTLHARLAGTTSRFLTALCALGPGPYLVDGAPPLRARPMAPLHDALGALGAQLTPGERSGHLPVTVVGLDRSDRLGSRIVQLRGDVSSQYVSALMLIGPYVPGGLIIELTTPLISRPYVELTKVVMAGFGVGDVQDDGGRIAVGPGSYSATRYVIEPDASSASYPLAAAAIVGGAVTVTGLGTESPQGDVRFAQLLAAMGCEVRRDRHSTTVRRGPSLRGITVDMSDISDIVPTLAVVAAFAASPTRITGVGFIRQKESDRIGDLVNELRRLGVAAREEPDGLVVAPSTPIAGQVQTHHDHRLAMSLALVGLRTPGVEIEDPMVVSKSWPEYWTMLRGLAKVSGSGRGFGSGVA